MNRLFSLVEYKITPLQSPQLTAVDRYRHTGFAQVETDAKRLMNDRT